MNRRSLLNTVALFGLGALFPPTALGSRTFDELSPEYRKAPEYVPILTSPSGWVQYDEVEHGPRSEMVEFLLIGTNIDNPNIGVVQQALVLLAKANTMGRQFGRNVELVIHGSVEGLRTQDGFQSVRMRARFRRPDGSYVEKDNAATYSASEGVPS